MSAARVLLLDHQDSFTFNLVQALQALGAQVNVVQGAFVRPAAWKAWRPSHVVLSPGPGHPRDARGALAAVKAFAGRKPLLGVCLGHQVLALAFGAQITRAERPMHGKTSRVLHEGKDLYRGLPQGFAATRYHSLCVQAGGLPPGLQATAWTEQGEIMGLRHTSGAQGVQFHPESILTACGTRLLSNFLS